MNGMGSTCMLEELRSDGRAEGRRRLRLTLHEQSPQKPPTGGKPIGRAFALVQPANERQPLKTQPIKPEEKVEVIKVYLEARRQEQADSEESLKMLSQEVSQIQEVRYCLKSLREQMAAKTNHRTEHKLLLTQNGLGEETGPLPTSALTWDSEDNQNEESEEDPARMREVSRRLYSQLQEAERRHQEEREKLQAEACQYKRELSEQSKRLKQAHDSAQQQDQQIRELQRLMGGMEQESSSLREELLIREAKLLQLQELKEEAEASRERLEELEKENAILREKIHHLDDMLKSQQRKLRQMIEQLQNSRMLIQERDRVIKDLEEKVAFLEAENKQMRDQMDYLLDGQRSSSHLLPDHNAQIVYSKPLKPSTQSSKSLPFIKVIEIKS
ncbi:tuftelin 1a [Electrophorus electricus]|uniref:tuftelin 1a n=1 Tax=Electrophorus electricus TaxID=8005 RepID=UPI0015D0B7DF|nr:tuftelin 1a [Electrophorus electricus]